MLAGMVLLLTIFADQATKSIVGKKIASGEHLPVSDNLVFTHVVNGGLFMNAGEDIPKDRRLWVLSLISAATIGWFGYRSRNLFMTGKIAAVGTALVIGGGSANLYDRLIDGHVTDLVYLEFGAYSSGIFNLADVALTLGAFLVIFAKAKTMYRTSGIQEPIFNCSPDAPIPASMEKN